MLVTSIFSFFPKKFSTLSKTNFIFEVAFILSSASSLDWPKILSFGKELITVLVTIFLNKKKRRKIDLSKFQGFQIDSQFLLKLWD